MSTVYHSLEASDLFQDWSDTSLLSRSHDWSRVASIMGFRGETLASNALFLAQTVADSASSTYVAANQTDPDSYLTAGVAEFELANPTVAIAGSSTARAPYLALYLDATGRENLTLSFTARDLEAGGDNAVQQIGVQYRIGGSGAWTNLPAGYIADASIANGTRDTAVTVTLPDAVNGQAQVEVRIITTDAVGYDEWIGIDDIRVTSQRDADYRPDPIAIFEVQGEAHVSPYAGKLVATSGIVTAVDAKGFFVQAAQGDGNAATSDAVYVQRGALPGVKVGDAVTLMGLVSEVVNGDGLTRTEVLAEDLIVTSHGNALPEAVLIGVGGLLPPTEVIEDDALASYDPASDGIDFWEALEGMRVTLDTPQAVSNTDRYGQTEVVMSLGAASTGLNSRGGLTIGAGDWNPEKIQVDDKLIALDDWSIGDQLSSITGVVSYSSNRYEVLATEAVTVTHDAVLTRESTALVGDANHLTVATYNLGNLDPGDTTFDLFARDIVYNLAAPDVLAVQKLQDADGTGTGADLSGTATAQALIDAIAAESGIVYTYVEIAPDAANTTAGQLDGNIRLGYFYRADRVSLVEGSLSILPDAVFTGTRKPLIATWEFNGEQVTTINVHFTTRFGSDPLWGDEQPAYQAGTIMRTRQIDAVGDYVFARLASDPALKLMIAGDWGGYAWERAQTQLTDSGLLTNLALTIDAADRYSAIVEGNAQLLENIVVSNGLLGRTSYDLVHMNSEFTGAVRATDHDAQVASIRLTAAPTDLVLSKNAIAENMAAGSEVGTFSVTDTAGEVLRFELTDDAGGRFAVDAETGVLRTAAPLDFEAGRNYTITARVTDSAGLSTTITLPVTVTDVNEAPNAQADSFALDYDWTSVNLWDRALSNDSDPDAGDSFALVAVDSGTTLGSLVFDPATQTLRYIADAQRFATLAPGEVFHDQFTYTIVDSHGLTSTATMTVTITGQDTGITVDGITVYGGNGKDGIQGTRGRDYLYGDNASDKLFGGAGNDWLEGRRGSDELTGGSGRDKFVFDRSSGSDIITDFNVLEDTIVFSGNMAVRTTKLADYNGDGAADLQLHLTSGGTLTLYGISSLDGVSIHTIG